MRLRQHAVHSNGTKKITYQGCVHSESCTNTGGNNHSDNGYSNHSDNGYDDHSNSGYDNHSNSGYDNHSNSCQTYTKTNGSDSGGACAQNCEKHNNQGCSNHTNSCIKNHINTGANNHTDTGADSHTDTGYNNHVNSYNYLNGYTTEQITSTAINSNLPSYILNSSLSDKGVNLAANTIVLDLSSAYSGGQRYRIYVHSANLGTTTFGSWQLVTEQGPISTFSVDISSGPQEQVQFAVTAYNGSSGSAIPTNDGTGWTYDHYQSLTASDNTTYTTTTTLPNTGKNGKTSTRTQIIVSDTTQYEVAGGSYAISNILQIIRYAPPKWLTDPWAKSTTDQLHNEINKALKTFTGETYAFTNTPIVQNGTVIKIDDLADMQTQVNKLMTAAGKTTVDFSSKDYMNGTAKINSSTALKDLQDLMDSLGK